MAMKEEVLKILMEAEGTYISGRMLGERLFCSRNAIWKAVAALKEEGYRIDAIPNRGYALSGGDVFSSIGVTKYLQAPCRVAVQKTVTSTNAVLKTAAEQGAPEGSVTAALCQTGGKGRLGRTFYSPAGGLYMSILLRPRAGTEEALMITAAAAVAVAEAIEAVCGRHCGIKWVNDLFLDGRKVCGILTEASMDFETGGLQYAIVGIGINIEMPAEGFPGELRGIAGAIYQKMPPDADIRNRLCAAVCNAFFRYYARLPERSFMNSYKERSILPGRQVLVLQGGNARPAAALAVDDDARLLVRYGDGTEALLSTGEVSIRFQEQQRRTGE